MIQAMRPGLPRAAGCRNLSDHLTPCKDFSMIRLQRNVLLLAGLAIASTLSWADRLDDIKKAGVVRVAAFDANPPFGFVDAKTKKIVGLDVDYAKEFAKKLGVKLEVVPTNPANRIPLLTSNKVDLVFANFTITEERAKVVNFSIPYFASGTQFIAKKGTLKSPDQLNSLRIGVDKGTTNEIQLRQQYPQATLVAYDDTPFAFTALRNGNVQAISQDGPKLIGLLANVPDRDKYEVPPFAISQDYIGVGIPKDEAKLTDFVNTTLSELEADGRAQKIYDAWFGPKTKTPLKRIFKIGDKTT
jgi:polar amino acid transport system substrate-binding protein